MSLAKKLRSDVLVRGSCNDENKKYAQNIIVIVTCHAVEANCLL